MIGLLLERYMSPWLRKHGGTLLKLLAIGAALISILTLGCQSSSRKRQLDRQDECFAYLETSNLAGAKGGQRGGCPPQVLALYDAAIAAETCEAALKLDGYSTDCSTTIAQLLTDKVSLRAQLDTDRNDQAAAIARAELRATRSVLRKTQDAKALAAAPHADGLIVCDADCLRARFEGDVQ